MILEYDLKRIGVGMEKEFVKMVNWGKKIVINDMRYYFYNKVYKYYIFGTFKDTFKDILPSKKERFLNYTLGDVLLVILFPLLYTLSLILYIYTTIDFYYKHIKFQMIRKKYGINKMIEEKYIKQFNLIRKKT